MTIKGRKEGIEPRDQLVLSLNALWGKRLDTIYALITAPRSVGQKLKKRNDYRYRWER